MHKQNPTIGCLFEQYIKSIVKRRWIEYVHLLDNAQQIRPLRQNKLKSPDKAVVVELIESGPEYLQANSDVVMKTLLGFGITNTLDGSEK